jgi:hypothetical protein
MTTHNHTDEAKEEELPDVRPSVENLDWTEARILAARAASPPLSQSVYDGLKTLLREKLQHQTLTPSEQSQIAQNLLALSRTREDGQT